jgi:hypothetical protein
VLRIEHAIHARTVRQAAKKRLFVECSFVAHRAIYPATPAPAQISL